MQVSVDSPTLSPSPGLSLGRPATANLHGSGVTGRLPPVARPRFDGCPAVRRSYDSEKLPLAGSGGSASDKAAIAAASVSGSIHSSYHDQVIYNNHDHQHDSDPSPSPGSPKFYELWPGPGLRANSESPGRHTGGDDSPRQPRKSSPTRSPGRTRSRCSLVGSGGLTSTTASAGYHRPTQRHGGFQDCANPQSSSKQPPPTFPPSTRQERLEKGACFCCRGILISAVFDLLLARQALMCKFSEKARAWNTPSENRMLTFMIVLALCGEPTKSANQIEPACI